MTSKNSDKFFDIFYAKILMEINHGVIIIDPSGKIILWNTWIEKHSRIRMNEALGFGFFDLFPLSENNIRLKTSLNWCLESGKYSLISERFGVSLIPLTDNNGNLINSRIIINPVKFNNYCYACIEIYDSSSYLAKEHFSRDQAKKLKNTQTTLVETSRLAALGEMAGGIAHEINTPLGAIILRANQIKRTIEKFPENNEKILEYANTIISVGHKVESIIKGLRHFSRNTGSDPFIYYKVSLIIDETILLCASRLENNSIEVIIEIEDSSIEISCRPTQISQVLLNLISNAQHAVKNFGDKKWIKIKTQKDENWLLIKVTDSGPGIPDEIIGKIFQPFFTTKDLDEGTGLGLSISTGIVKEHGGSLTLDRSAKNTTFVIKVPIINRVSPTSI